MLLNSNYKLSVGIISYNRPAEILRTVRSLFPLPTNVEVVICDDDSPRKLDIIDCLQEFLVLDNFKFVQNPINLGYDRNLFHVIQRSSSQFVLLLGDDDFLEENALLNLVQFIDNSENFHCGFLGFYDSALKRRHRSYISSKYFSKDRLISDSSFVFNSILFSGLVFRRDSVLENSGIFEKYMSSIYIQVAIFSILSYKYGSYFIEGPGIVVGGDGENGFGLNSAADANDSDLIRRTSVVSNLSYHKRLFIVLKQLDVDLKFNIFSFFVKEYNLRSIKALLLARNEGRKQLFLYWRGLLELDIFFTKLLFPLFILLLIFPNFFFPPIFFLLEKFIILKRKNITYD
jgi:glycosyltransferase involved in cell wall biosynthesis